MNYFSFASMRLTHLKSIVSNSLIQCQHEGLVQGFIGYTNVHVRYAGHSKWRNIAHTKAAKDLEKTKNYGHFINRMRAATSGNQSTDPRLNSKLAAVYEEAQACNVSIVTLKGALEKFQKQKLNCKSALFEYRGPKGVLMLISVNSPAIALTKGAVKKLLIKSPLNFTADTNARSAFYHKGYVIATPPPDVTNVSERSMEDAIEVDAEEVEPSENDPKELVFTCSPQDVVKLKSKLETKKYTVVDAGEDYIPRVVAALDDEEMENLAKVVQLLEEMEDVDKVFVNV